MKPKQKVSVSRFELTPLRFGHRIYYNIRDDQEDMTELEGLKEEAAEDGVEIPVTSL
jgi:hypothetical protein